VRSTAGARRPEQKPAGSLVKLWLRSGVDWELVEKSTECVAMQFNWAGFSCRIESVTGVFVHRAVESISAPGFQAPCPGLRHRHAGRPKSSDGGWMPPQMRESPAWSGRVIEYVPHCNNNRSGSDLFQMRAKVLERRRCTRAHAAGEEGRNR